MRYPGEVEPIHPEEAQQFIGQKVYLTWAYRACAWVLRDVRGTEAWLSTPRSEKILRASVKDLLKLKVRQ